MIRQFSSFKKIENVKERLEVIFRNSKLVWVLREKFLTVPRSLKDQSASVLRLWAHQCECVMAQRLRRGQQMFCLYSKLWEERALRDFFRQMKQRMGIKGRDFLIGALGVAVYDWQSNRISDHDIIKHLNEFAYVYKLRGHTVNCPCAKIKKPILPSYDNWKVFIEKKDLIVWRRLNSSGTYEYKVYGSYSDVTAEDFLNVQIDINYRKQWDNTAVVLDVVEKDPDPKSNSDIIYWEMLWPTLFANRDYVFNRRYLVDYKNKTLFLVSKSTKHPSCPKQGSKYRIEDYWSYMVIKPYSELNKPGIEFSLTYYDNPGVNIPSSVTTWVAMKAMPDFCERLREASRKYKRYCQDSGVCQVCNVLDFSEPVKRPYWEYFDDEFVDNTVYEAHYRIEGPEEHTMTASKPPQFIEDSENLNTQTPSSQSQSSSFWRYLHPTYYFS